MDGVGCFFSDYRVSSNFLMCWGWVVVEVGLGCDKNVFDMWPLVINTISHP